MATLVKPTDPEYGLLESSLLRKFEFKIPENGAVYKYTKSAYEIDKNILHFTQTKQLVQLHNIINVFEISKNTYVCVLDTSVDTIGVNIFYVFSGACNIGLEYYLNLLSQMLGVFMFNLESINKSGMFYIKDFRWLDYSIIELEQPMSIRPTENRKPMMISFITNYSDTSKFQISKTPSINFVDVMQTIRIAAFDMVDNLCNNKVEDRAIGTITKKLKDLSTFYFNPILFDLDSYDYIKKYYEQQTNKNIDHNLYYCLEEKYREVFDIMMNVSSFSINLNLMDMIPKVCMYSAEYKNMMKRCETQFPDKNILEDVIEMSKKVKITTIYDEPVSVLHRDMFALMNIVVVCTHVVNDIARHGTKLIWLLKHMKAPYHNSGIIYSEILAYIMKNSFNIYTFKYEYATLLEAIDQSALFNITPRNKTTNPALMESDFV